MGEGLLGNCPNCLLALAVAAGAGGPAQLPGVGTMGSPHSLRYFGDYELLRELARGGMGIVYAARQISLNRPVALKMVAAGHLATPALVQRFRQEAEAAARLHHPHIVPIYEIGEHQGHHFYSMELVEGGTLAEQVPQDHRQIASLISKIARAVHYAHQHGVMHRDLKPANVLIDGQGDPRVADFGLAKLLESDNELTRSHATLGTPAYMAPEQASGQARQITTSADVYGVGAILYHLLAGRPPFAAASAVATMRRVLDEEPVPPRLVHPVDRDLETICLKCLNKDPGRRYDSAAALADDLDRWLHGETIQARPVSGAERLWRWCRRKPALAGLSLAVLLLVATLAVGSTISAWRIAGARRAEQAERNRAISANLQLASANVQLRQSVAQLQLQQAEALIDAGDAGLSLAHLATILRRDPSNAIAAERLSSLLLHRPFALPVTYPLPHHGQVTIATFSPSGHRVLTASFDGTAQLWDPLTGQPSGPPMTHRDRVWSARFSPDGARLITASADRTARVWDANTSRPITPPLAHQGEVLSACFSPDGQQAATAGTDRLVRLWNVTNGQALLELRGHTGGVLGVGFSPDGTLLLSSSMDGTARLWDARSGQPRGDPFRHRARVTAAVYSPDGELFVTTSYDRSARVWETHTGRQRFSLPHDHQVLDAAFSPDGRRLVTCSQTAQLWDLQTGQQSGRPLYHEDGVSFAAFSPDGSQLVTASIDNTARLWDVKAGEQLCQPLRRAEQVVHADFSPDGHRLVVAAYDWAAQVWDITPLPAQPLTLPHRGMVHTTAFSPEGRFVATASQDRTARVWDARNGLPVGPWLAHDQGVLSVAFSADGRRLVTASTDRTARAWDIATGRSLGQPLRHEAAVKAACFTLDGQRIITGSLDGSARIWQCETGEPVGAPMTHHAAVNTLACSPDGRAVATASADSSARVWDTRTGAPLTPPLSHADAVNAVAFSPDGRTVATGSSDNTARVWDARTGEPVTPLLRHVRSVTSLCFDPAGRRLATASLDRTARIWEVSTGRALTEPMKHLSPVATVVFSGNGRRLATATDRGLLRLWHPDTGRELSEPLPGQGFTRASFSPDGERLLCNGADGLGRIWDVPSPTIPVPAWLPDLAEALAGCRLSEQGSLDVMRRGAYFEVADSLRGRLGDDYYSRLARWLLAKPSDRPLSPFTAITPLEAQHNRLAQLGIPPRESSVTSNQIDLSGWYNDPLAGNWPSRLEPGNDLAALPLGLVELGGVAFDVRGVIQLAGGNTLSAGFSFPDRITNIPIHRSCRRLHFLHGIVASSAEGVEFAHFRLHRDQGLPDRIPLRMGLEARDWWSSSGGLRPVTNAVVAWIGENPVATARGFKLRLFAVTWENPHPELPINILDYFSAVTAAAPFLIAITAEPAVP